MKHAWSATSPLPRTVNHHHRCALGDCADVFPRLLQGEMTQLPLSASLTTGAALSSVNHSDLNTVWLNRRGQNTGCIIRCVRLSILVVPNPFCFFVWLCRWAQAPLHCTSSLVGRFHHKENTERLLFFCSFCQIYIHTFHPFIYYL